MNKELVPLQKKVSALATKVESIKITNPDEMKTAVTVLSQINSYADSVKEKKDTLTKPINTALKNIRAMFKPLEESYEEAIEVLRSKMTKYQTQEVTRIRDEEAKIAERVKEGKGNLKIETAVKKMAELDKPEREVATSEGLVQFREVKKFEVMDITLLPIEYHLANEQMIQKAMKEGVEVTGVRYFTEQVPVNYR